VVVICIYGITALCQTTARDSAKTFKIHKAFPEIKTLFSRSNMLYQGRNPLILEGIDSTHASHYFLHTSDFIPIHREGEKFYLNISLYAISHNIITLPGSIIVFIYKVNSPDTILIGSQQMDIVGGELPQPVVMVGENILIPGHEPKKDLLANPSFTLISQYSDYNSCFKVCAFAITIGSQVYYCKSDSFSDEIITALKNYKGKYVTVGSVFAAGPDGLAIQFIGTPTQ
jgi:hypothetical protein